MKWFVSRQSYWGVDDEPFVVEIAKGGCDYANADMLSDTGTSYASLGCGEEYKDPRKALEAAIKIRDEWQKNCGPHKIRIEHGFTMGMTMPFMSFPTDEELKQWAEKAWEALPRCARCGETYEEGKGFYLWEDMAERFCSAYCAGETSTAFDTENEEEEEDDQD